MHFFNPVIFYRPVEFAAGTYDNALLGFGLNVRIFKNSYLYSQLIIDDLIISELKQATGWWGNKYGIQAGFKSYSLFNIDHLFFLSEINAVRPFTYSHARDNINYGNYQMPMAHPEGANFLEALNMHGIVFCSQPKHSCFAQVPIRMKAHSEATSIGLITSAMTITAWSSCREGRILNTSGMCMFHIF